MNAKIRLKCQLSQFGDGVKESHLTVLPKSRNGVREQLEEIKELYHENLRLHGIKSESAVFLKFFCSDIVNQAQVFSKSQWLNPTSGDRDFATMFVEQPPLGGGKLGLWAYHLEAETARREKVPGGIAVSHNGYQHLWTGNMHAPLEKGTYLQTCRLFEDYNKFLSSRNLRLDLNCIRTWIYVHDIDHRYQGMVRARKELFEDQGLNPGTHYIASTGIEGRMGNIDTLVFMDAYSLGGVQKRQIQFLKAAENMSPTYDYGVTFERGTAVHYGDRKHIFISGTASINHKGALLYPGNVPKQMERTIENIAVLLAEAHADPTDIVQMLVYLRDASDYRLVDGYMQEHYPGTPFLILQAPVCRPGWLIEIECIAIRSHNDPNLNNL